MVLAKNEDGWLLENMMADIDPFERKAPTWEHYDYGEVTFVSAVMTGSEFSAWLSELKGEVGGYKFQIPSPQPRVNSERYTSRSNLRELYLLPYPFTLFPVEFENRSDGERRSDFTPLVKDGLPSFPNFGTALYRLLYDLDRSRGTGIPRNQIHDPHVAPGGLDRGHCLGAGDRNSQDQWHEGRRDETHCRRSIRHARQRSA